VVDLVPSDEVASAHVLGTGLHRDPAADPGHVVRLPAREMAHGQYWIHPALPELIEKTLLSLTLDGPITWPADERRQSVTQECSRQPSQRR